MVSTGMTRAFGAHLHQMIASGTRSRGRAFLVGVGATVILQSSTATSLMTASFAAQGLMNTPAALAVVLGADVGTSLVARALSFNVQWLSPALLIMGVALFKITQRNRLKAIGRFVIGLGMLLLALSLLSQSAQPMLGSAIIQEMLGALRDAPGLALVIGAVLVVVAHSSLAIILLVVSLATHGLIDLTLCLALVLGANLGGAAPPMLATLSQGTKARQVPMGNALARLSGCIVAIQFLPEIAELLELTAASPHNQAINFHVAFNLALAAVWLPLVDHLAKAVRLALPETPSPDDATQPRHLDPTALETPSIAIACATREALRIGDMAEIMLQKSLDALRQNDPQIESEISRIDDAVDRLHHEIKLYLAKLGQAQMDESEARRTADIMAFVINVEHIGDIIDRNLMDHVGKKNKRRLRFSPDEMSDISDLHARTALNLRNVLSVFIANDDKLARDVIDAKEHIRQMEKTAAERHLDRLRHGRLESMETSTLHLDVLRDLKRINTHIAAIAYPVIRDEPGPSAATAVSP